MCLIIFAPHLSRARIRKGALERAFNQHDDGAGFAYVKDGQLIVSKGHMTFPEFYADYVTHRPIIGAGPCLIHFRAMSVGPIVESNTQPIVIDQSVVMAHNGTMDNLSDEAWEKDITDSRVFGKLVTNMGWTFPYSKAQLNLLSAIAGSSRIVFLGTNRRAQILNESAGKWSRGAWYSNDKTMDEDKPAKAPPSMGWRSEMYRGGSSPGPTDDDTLGDEDHDEEEFNKALREAEVTRLSVIRNAKPLRPLSSIKDDAGVVRAKLGRWERKRKVMAHMKACEDKGVNFDPDLLSSEDWIAWQQLGAPRHTHILTS